MKHIITTLILVLGSTFAHAADDCIIDTELMNKDVWAEPVFRAPGERSVADESSAEAKPAESDPTQYLDVLAKIPFSEPTVHKVWLEHRILNRDE